MSKFSFNLLLKIVIAILTAVFKELPQSDEELGAA